MRRRCGFRFADFGAALSYSLLGGVLQCYDERHMSAVSPAYFEIIDFIAAGTTPEAVASFRPSPEAQQRVANLIEREKESGLSREEKAELDHFEELEHILRMAKAKARQILARAH
jgi:hypothetical protein